MIKRVLYGTFYVLVYLTLTLSPLFVLLIGPAPPGRTFWTEFSVALGFAGLAIIGFQFLLTARFKHMTSPYGIDIIYHFHRQISLMALALILAHPVILFVTRPETISLLNLATAPWRAQMGVASLVALIIVITTSLWRQRLGIPYETWRVIHAALAVVAVGTAVAHIVGVGYYVSIPWKQALWVTLGLGWIGALLYVRLIKPFIMLKRPYRVTQVTEEHEGTWTLVLEPEGHKGLRFMPGQFAWLTIWSSPFAIREHPFSFSSSAVDSKQLALTIKALGDFTSTIGRVTPGTRVYLDGPYGSFSTDVHRASGYVFLAGGVGITPIISILRTLADRRDPRHLLLIYASKLWEQTTFREELERLKGRLNLQVVHVLEQPPEEWKGEAGFVSAELIARYLPENRVNIEYFVCGPAPMMDVVEDALLRLGLPLERAQSERFNLV